MIRKINGHYADPNSTRDLLGIKPHQYALFVEAIQRMYNTSVAQRDTNKAIELLQILQDINQPYPGAEYPPPAN